MSDISQTPIGLLESRGLIHSPVFQGASGKPGRYAYRGELALKLAPTTAGEKRPPLLKSEQVIMLAEGDKLVFFAGFVDSLGALEDLAAVLGDYLTPAGRYYCFAGNVDLLKKYRVDLGGVEWLVLPLDEATVYNELLELFLIEKGDLKKLDNGAKVEAIVAGAMAYTPSRFAEKTYADALAEMGPVKVVENRPV